MGKRQNLTAKTYDLLLQQLLQHRLVAGQRLIFIDLAEQYSVSRTPVHNALSILAQQGYLDLTPHKGYTVHTFNHTEITNLVELKEVLEKALIFRAGRASRKQLRAIQRCKMFFDTAVTNDLPHILPSHDLDFHLTIAALADNQPAVELYRETLQKLYLAAMNSLSNRPAMFEVSAEHNEIFEAIRLNDLARAAQLTINHQPLIMKKQRSNNIRKSDTTRPQPACSHAAGIAIALS